MTSGLRGAGSRTARPALALLALSLGTASAVGADRDLKIDPPEATYSSSSAARPVGPPMVAMPLDRDALPELVGPAGTWRGTPLRRGGIDIAMRSRAFTTGIATEGDLDGDGDEDLIIAQPCSLATHPGLENCCAGRVLVFWAPRDLPDLPRQFFGDEMGDWTLLGGCSTTELGTRLAVADLNGDGFEDLIAGGLAGWDGFGTSDTCLYGVFGPVPPDGTLDLYDTPADFRICLGDSFGESMAAGDFDGDLTADIAVSGADGVHIFRGQRLLGNVDWARPDSLIVLPAGSRGTPLASNVPLLADDVDGDGRDDLLIGLAGGDGEVDLVLGRTPLPPVVDLNVTAPDLAVFGSSAMRLGSSVAVGHWTPDAALDLVAGAPGSDGPGGSRPDAGAVVALDGLDTLRGTVDLALTAPDVMLHGVDAGDRLGDGASGRGLLVDDVGGDGIADIAAWSSGASGVANFSASAVGETYVIYGDVPGSLDLFESVGDPTALAPFASDVASPWDGPFGLLDDGDLHFFRLEGPVGVELTIFVTKQGPSRTVRISWWDGRAAAIAVDPVASTVTLSATCARPDVRTAVRLKITPRDAAGELLGAGLDVRPAVPDAWLPGLPAGGFQDLGNGSYEVEVASALASTSTVAAETEGVTLPSPAPVTFTDSAPMVMPTHMPAQGVAGTEFAFSASIADGFPPFTYEWDFDGNGTTDSMEVAPRYVFARPGSYLATLNVTDAVGCTGRGAVAVLVGP
jgi:hypothetical protein